MWNLKEKNWPDQFIQTQKETNTIKSFNNWLSKITSKIKSFILNVLLKDDDRNSLKSIVTIWEWDYISLKSEYSNNIIVLWRVLKIHMRRVSSLEHQICYDIEIYRSKKNTLVDIQDIFNWNEKLKTETHDMATINKRFEKIDFKTK